MCNYDNSYLYPKRKAIVKLHGKQNIAGDILNLINFSSTNDFKKLLWMEMFTTLTFLVVFLALI